MKPLKTTIAAIISAASLTSTMAQSATFDIDSVTLDQLFSSTFDGLVYQESVGNDGSFFGVIPNIDDYVFGVNRTINVISQPGGSGHITFDENNNLTELSIGFPDLTMNILTVLNPYTTLTVETSGVGLHIGTHPIEDSGHIANQLDVGGDITENSKLERLYVSPFNDINNVNPQSGAVDSCISTGTGSDYCPIIPGLSLNATRYTLEGTPTDAGGDTFILRAQTFSNNSYYEITFTTAVASSNKNVPAMGAFGLIALFAGLITIGARLRSRAIK